MSNVPKIRNADNSAWIDVFCKGGWRVRTLQGHYMLMTASNTKVRNASNTAWLNISCPIVYPPSGTELSRQCVGTTLQGTYANGTGGSYNANIEVNSPTCGYVPPFPAAGTLLSQFCSGYDLMGTYANGSGGSYNSLITANSVLCGAVQGVYKSMWGGPGTLGLSARDYFKTILSEPGSAVIRSGPNTGQTSALKWIGTNYGYDPTYHPVIGVAQFGTQWNSMTTGTAGYTDFQLKSINSATAGVGVSQRTSVSGSSGWWYTRYYDEGGIGPGTTGNPF